MTQAWPLMSPKRKLVAHHPALASKIAYAMGFHAAACAIKLFGGFAKLIPATADAITIAISADAAFISGWDNQAGDSLIAPGHSRRGICRHGHSNCGESNSEKLLHGWREYQPWHRQERFKITARDSSCISGGLGVCTGPSCSDLMEAIR